LVWLCASGVRAEAGDSRFELSWDAPEGCPDEAAVQRALADYLGPAPAASRGDAEPPQRMQVQIEIESVDSGGFAAQIEIEHGDDSGERTFEAQDCARAAEAAILIVALAIDPAGMAARATDKPKSQVNTAQTRVRESEPWRLTLGVQLVGDLGSLPGPTAGAGLSLGLLLGRLHVEALGTALLPRVTGSGPAAGSDGEIGMYTAELRGCVALLRFFDRALGVAPCLAAEAGQTWGQGLGLARRRTRTEPWLAGWLGLSVRQVVGQRWQFGLTAEAGLPLHRPQWVIDDFGQIFQTAVVGGRLTLHAAVLLP
jgi:hypothetical protein